MYRPALILSVAFLWGSIGCGNKHVSDGALATQIKAKLYSDAATKPAAITVGVKDGVVTLGGDVPTADVELAAMKMANGTAGVKRVDDQMKVNAAVAENSPAPSASAQPESTPTPQSAPGPAAASESQAPPPSNPAPVANPAPAPVAPAPVRFTIPAGEHVTVRTIETIDSSHNVAGQVFRATLYSPLVSHRTVVVPAGARVSILLANSQSAGRFKGHSSLEVRLSSLEYHGRRYRIDSSIYEETGKGRGAQTAKRTGIGAVAGAIIGGIAGGGKGAAIGAGAGAGAGAGVQLFTHGQKVRIPSETLLTFRLRAPLRIEK